MKLLTIYKLNTDGYFFRTQRRQFFLNFAKLTQIFGRNLDTHCTQVRSFLDDKSSLEKVNSIC